MKNSIEVERFLDSACKRLPFGKLKKRVKNELSEHIEDIYFDNIGKGELESDAEANAVNEMGDPIELAKQLYQSHKLRIRLIRLSRVLTAFVVIFFLMFVLPEICSQVRVFAISKTVEESEQMMSTEYN